MQAVCKLRPGKDGVALVDTPEPVVGPGQVKIKVHAGGICGTDIHILKDEFACDYPVIMGHEYSGVVAEVAADVTAFRPGDKVVSMTRIVTCGQCRYCHEGVIMLCPESKSIGYGVNGAFAEYIVVPAKFVFIVPDNVSLDEAALCEPLACAVHAALDRGQVTAGDRVLVSGPGIIGVLVAQVALAAGATVAVAGTIVDEQRLGYAKNQGCEIIMVDQGDPLQRCGEITDGQGFDIVFECAGVAPSVTFCLQAVRKGGLYVQTGLFAKPVEADFNLAVVKEITIAFEYGHQWKSWERALTFLRNGQIDVKPLIGSKFALTDWRQAFDAALAKKYFKVLFTP